MQTDENRLEPRSPNGYATLQQANFPNISTKIYFLKQQQMSIKNDIHTWLSTQVYMQATRMHVCYFNKNTGIFIALARSTDPSQSHSQTQS